MRVNLRKIILISGGFILLWLVVSYSSFFVPVSKKRGNIEKIETELDNLQNKMLDQLSDSYKLLDKVKQHLRKTDHQEISKDSPIPGNRDGFVQ
ncbi:acetylglucosaminyltransferase, partial [Danaus plexippus plexippus]